MHVSDKFVVALASIAVAAIAAGCVLAIVGYSSAGAFSVAAASVGVLGTLAAQKVKGVEPQEPTKAEQRG